MTNQMQDELPVSSRFYCGQLKKFRTAVEQHRDVSCREGTRFGQERSLAYQCVLDLIERFFPEITES